MLHVGDDDQKEASLMREPPHGVRERVRTGARSGSQNVEKPALAATS